MTLYTFQQFQARILAVRNYSDMVRELRKEIRQELLDSGYCGEDMVDSEVEYLFSQCGL